MSKCKQNIIINLDINYLQRSLKYLPQEHDDDDNDDDDDDDELLQTTKQQA